MIITEWHLVILGIILVLKGLEVMSIGEHDNSLMDDQFWKTLRQSAGLEEDEDA